MSRARTRARKSKRGESWRQAREVLHAAMVRFFREDSLLVSSSIAYHSLLAIFPLFLILLGVSGLYIRRFELSGSLAQVMERYVPIRADFIMRNLVGITHAYGKVTFLSILLLFWSSSGVFLPLEKALNRAWDVQETRPWWRKRVLALEMAVIVSFLVLVSSFIMAFNVHIHTQIRFWFPSPALPLAEFGYHILIASTTFGVTLAMFIVLFERLPNRPMSFNQVFPSALLTALFWEGARSLFTLLLPFFNYRQVYGSIGVVVALMTWAYISSAVMLFGAQVSRSLYGTWRPPAPEPASSATSRVESPANAP